MANSATDIVAKLKSWNMVDKDRFVPVERLEHDYGSRPSGWRSSDLALMEKRNVDLRKLLSKSRVDFNVYILADPEIGKDFESLGEGRIERKVVNNIYRMYGRKTLPDDKKAINVVLTGLGSYAETDGNLPPTPWIMVHWLAHAVLKAKGDLPYYTDLEEAVVDHVFAEDYEGGYRSVTQEHDVLDFLHQAAATKAARTGKLRNAAEGWHELMAHYLVSGKVRTNRKLNAKGHENMNITSDRWSRNRDKFNKQVKVLFDDALKSSVGKWFVV